eukprot:SAG22_NODE_2228_length_2813_cov_1.258290_4_plen_60_part_00
MKREVTARVIPERKTGGPWDPEDSEEERRLLLLLLLLAVYDEGGLAVCIRGAVTEAWCL